MTRRTREKWIEADKITVGNDATFNASRSGAGDFRVNGATTDDLIIVDADAETVSFQNVQNTVTVPVVLDTFVDLNSRNLNQNVHGGLDPILTAQAVSSGSPINATVGIGKVVLAVLAGTDTAGTITVTGTSVNRNTGVETGSDTDTITISGLTTDDSTTDAEGDVIHDLTDAYITSKWFKGAVTISTTDVNLSDVDVYTVAFEQFNDTSNLTIQTFDSTMVPINNAAFAYLYLYTVKVTGSKVTIQAVATLALPAAVSVANRFYRLRKGQIGEALDGTTDGIFVEINLGPDPLLYITQLTVKVWALLELPINSV